MTKFDVIGASFLLVGALLTLLSLKSWWSYARVRKRGRTEERPARVQLGRGLEQSRQVRLCVDLEDSFGEPFELCSRSTCNDWIAYDGQPVTVHYDPDAPQQGWIELDFRCRLRLILIIAPLLLLIGGGVILLGQTLGQRGP